MFSGDNILLTRINKSDKFSGWKQQLHQATPNSEDAMRIDRMNIEQLERLLGHHDINAEQALLALDRLMVLVGDEWSDEQAMVFWSDVGLLETYPPPRLVADAETARQAMDALRKTFPEVTFALPSILKQGEVDDEEDDTWGDSNEGDLLDELEGVDREPSSFDVDED